ncbi:MAG: S41 family peptidase [Pyrinomonadaceae bacterium]|nr:S41 family peptidase [Pyrinomonadaceae bacterium]MCX7639733.1 S41 family peptidase [Pyrinomonadaceae bacterium]MDW8304316.1 S41 family peptidase [Acidobacteriota bacterium]
MKKTFIFLIVLTNSIISQTNESSKAKTESFKIGSGFSFSASTEKQSVELNEIVEDYRQALKIIQERHFDGKNLNYEKLTRHSITAMLHTLDPHSSFLTASEFRQILLEQRSEYYGIGAIIASYTINGITETYVTSTLPNSPALKAGLMFGDKIVAVDGEKMRGKPSAYVRDRIRGEKGKIVSLLVERASTGRIERFDIRRDSVPIPSISDAYVIRPGIGYINLSNGFTYTTKEEFDAAITELRRQSITALILDLRDNPGGILEQAVKVTEKFLPLGSVIVSQRGRYAIDNRTWRSSNGNPETMPLVILVNRYSASASEIVAGALQDHDRALIIGENTFGKGLVQSIFNLPLGTGLILTTARYYTPSGRLIQRAYNSENLYDYYLQKTDYKPDPNSAKKTTTGRTVYNGKGIMPDETVITPSINQKQSSLLDSIFFFVRELVNGRIRELEAFKWQNLPQFAKRIRKNDLPADEKLFNAFKSYLENQNPKMLKTLEEEKEFALLRLRYTIATALFGATTAEQVLIENDPQIEKAILSLPKADALAKSAQRKFLKTQK